MNRPLLSKAALLAAVAVGALGIAQSANARTDVYFSAGVPIYGGAPVYVEPQPAYVAPPVVYGPPAQVYVRPGDDDWRWRRQEWRREQWRREHWREEQWRRWHRRHEWQERDWD